MNDMYNAGSKQANESARPRAQWLVAWLHDNPQLYSSFSFGRTLFSNVNGLIVDMKQLPAL